MTPPKDLKLMLKGSFPAFYEIIGHIRFFYVADEIWNGESPLIFSANGEHIVTISLGDGVFHVDIADERFSIVDESSIGAVFEKLEKAAYNHRRPAEQLTVNPEGFPCGYRCDMCILNKVNNDSGTLAGSEFGYLNWLCYHNCLGDISVDRFDSTGHFCPGCEAVRESNPKYCKYVNCAKEKGYANCVECGDHHTCDLMRCSHHPGQCSLGMSVDEVTKLVVPYYMKWRLDKWANTDK
jgi:hypothetical protein